MKYVKARFKDISADNSDMLIAMLSDAGYNGFEEGESELIAYIGEEAFILQELEAIATSLGVVYEQEVLVHQNWNALWESNFQPVVVDGICTIRAHFHEIEVTTPYEIVITPKMSFGTGHHATTQQMMMVMNSMDLAGKSILDFGTGTGVLAIFAEMLGATSIYAIDNDEWSVENAVENAARNSCERIAIKQGSLEDLPAGEYDVILANINRHILLAYMRSLSGKLNYGGRVLMSGLLVDDKEIVVNAAAEAGLRLVKNGELNTWIVLLFEK